MVTQCDVTCVTSSTTMSNNNDNGASQAPDDFGVEELNQDDPTDTSSLSTLKKRRYIQKAYVTFIDRACPLVSIEDAWVKDVVRTNVTSFLLFMTENDVTSGTLRQWRTSLLWNIINFCHEEGSMEAAGMNLLIGEGFRDQLKDFVGRSECAFTSIYPAHNGIIPRST